MKMQRFAELSPAQPGCVCRRIFRVMDLPAGCPMPPGWIRVMPNVSPESHCWDAARQLLMPLPPRPSPSHRFSEEQGRWVADENAAWALVRAERDRLLTACDWRVARAMEAGEPLPAPWAAYRQALRNITEQADPLAIEWPMPPA